MIRSHKNVDKSRRNTSLARTGSHNKQALAMAFLNVCANVLDRLNLVVAFSATSYCLIHRKACGLDGCSTSIEKPLQIVLREDAAHLTRCAIFIINKEG